MLGWALTFFILAIIAGVLGFGGWSAPGSQWNLMQGLFVIFLVLLVISALVGVLQGDRRSG